MYLAEVQNQLTVTRYKSQALVTLLQFAAAQPPENATPESRRAAADIMKIPAPKTSLNKTTDSTELDRKSSTTASAKRSRRSEKSEQSQNNQQHQHDTSDQPQDPCPDNPNRIPFDEQDLTVTFREELYGKACDNCPHHPCKGTDCDIFQQYVSAPHCYPFPRRSNPLYNKEGILTLCPPPVDTPHDQKQSISCSRRKTTGNSTNSSNSTSTSTSPRMSSTPTTHRHSTTSYTPSSNT